jgi:hypothetical protein
VKITTTLKRYCNIKKPVKAGIYIFFLLVSIIYAEPSYAQEKRLADHNSIVWLAYTGTFKITPKVAVHTEYQWRRADGIKNQQQSLIRTGINYTLSKDISINAGYAFAETFAYGDYPVANAFPEHRVYEQVVIKNPIGNVDVSHRFTLEQRFVGKVVIQNGKENTDYTFLNRMRYRLRTEMPLKKNIVNNSWSIILQDEIFIGWGKNIGVSIFDQNRLAVLLGYRINQNIKIEAGYINQVLQQGQRINDQAVFQYNNGFMISTHLLINLMK